MRTRFAVCTFSVSPQPSSLLPIPSLLLNFDSPCGVGAWYSKLISASPSSSTTLHSFFNKLGKTCILVFISMAIFAGESSSMSAASPSSSPPSFSFTSVSTPGASYGGAGSCIGGGGGSASPSPLLLHLRLRALLLLLLPCQLCRRHFRSGEPLFQRRWRGGACVWKLNRPRLARDGLDCIVCVHGRVSGVISRINIWCA
ncbi:hypothetical protein FIBSPDRAFT_869066 [Athelia psychrophila]|uniref:Uncharacterized protein n=1 Tax=Athelia psychrophila TaxID=1759441 RepID=A0A166CHP9_9AGAM|nr:hypothetical protein FIBSPDRAFT_869066 [Fibularhizoctonia sp. CBS 109695]